MTGPDTGDMIEQLVAELLRVMRAANAASLAFPQLLAEAADAFGTETDWQGDQVFPPSYGSEEELIWRITPNSVRWNQRGTPVLTTLTNADLREGMRVASARMLSGMDDALDSVCEHIVRFAAKAQGRQAEE